MIRSPSGSRLHVADRPTQRAIEMSLVRAHWPGLVLGFSDGVASQCGRTMPNCSDMAKQFLKLMMLVRG